jgi:hypothetical protein
VNLPNDGVCDQHVPRAGNSGPIAPIQVRFRLTPRTHEYRLYRSVNGAPPTLIAQAEALYDPLNPNNELVRTDDAMPPSAARLCYFVQVLDENGNGSPLALMGCKDCVPPKPPTPVLSQPAPAGDTSNPQVAMSWFCPTAGVYRFEIRIQRADQPGSGKPTGFVSSQLLKLTAFKPLQSAGINANPRFYGLTRNRIIVSEYDEWQLTPPTGPTFGPGPQFSITASVVPNVPYHISVAAENIQGYWGDASTEWTFVWQPPPTFQTVPWPARPLPPVTQFDEPASLPQPVPAIYFPRVAAVVFTNANGGLLDVHYPVCIRFAALTPAPNLALGYNIGNTNLASYSYTESETGQDPNTAVFRRYANGGGALQNGQSLLPIVVYRKQETNSLFPRVSGNMSQVTPLLEQVPWYSYIPGPELILDVVIPDRLIALGAETFGIIGERGNFYSINFLYLRDQQPVILGARYHYYVIRLNDQREVAETIDAGAVDIPPQ